MDLLKTGSAGQFPKSLPEAYKGFAVQVFKKGKKGAGFVISFSILCLSLPLVVSVCSIQPVYPILILGQMGRYQRVQNIKILDEIILFLIGLGRDTQRAEITSTQSPHSNPKFTQVHNYVQKADANFNSSNKVYSASLY